ILIEPLRVTGSGILSTLTRGNGLLVIPEELEGFDEGSEVEVILLSPILEGDEM
ncbi:MAG: molybdopterin molybdenumtransferase MoeA, partial [Nitrososphaerota archaeon]